MQIAIRSRYRRSVAVHEVYRDEIGVAGVVKP